MANSGSETSYIARRARSARSTGGSAHSGGGGSARPSPIVSASTAEKSMPSSRETDASDPEGNLPS